MPRLRSDCPVCERMAGLLDDMLDSGLEQARQLHGPTTAEEDRHHLLAGICAWWVHQSLESTGGNPLPLAFCLANCLQHEGVSSVVSGPPPIKES